MHAYDHYLLAALAVLGTLLAVALIDWLVRHSRWADWFASLAGVAPPFINIVGVLFGLTLAFLANDTWSAHDRAISAVYREADALHAIVALGDSLAEPARGELRTLVRDYATASAAEWPLLGARQADATVLDKNDRLLRFVADPALATQVGPSVQAMLLAKSVQIRDEHDMRVALSQTHVNPLKWCGMAFLGFLTLLSVAAVHLDRPRAALVGVVLFAAAAAPTAAIVLVQGNPFQQPSWVTPAPIEAVVSKLN